MSGNAQLQRLMTQGAIMGYALFNTHTGACVSAHGELNKEMSLAPNPQPSPLARQLQELFHTDSTVAHLDVDGERAIIVQRSEGSVCAVSRGKQLCITAHHLPSGILVTVFGKPNLPQVVVPQVEAICQSLRQP